MQKDYLNKYITIIIFSLFYFTTVQGQSNKFNPPDRELYNEIVHMDSLLFDAFNKHDLTKFETFFTKDLEFYHNKSGLTRYKENMHAFGNLLNQNNGMRRELVKSSMEVYPLKGFGAVEIGVHTFYHFENEQRIQGTFKFIHIWQKKDGQWKISRVISYDH